MKTYDVESIKNRLINRLRSKSEWSDLLPYSVNVILLSAFSEEFEDLALYSEYLLQETKWSVCKNTSSILDQVKMLGYKPHRKIASEGKLRISASETFSAPPVKSIQINKYTSFSTDDLTFLSKNNYVITTADNYIDIDILQGELITINDIALGGTNEVYDIIDDSVDNNIVEVYINGVLWQPVNTVFDYEATDQVYEIRNIKDYSGVTIYFGDNINGKKLVTGDTILIKYIRTDGSQGNVKLLNFIDTVDTTIYDVDGDEVDVYCTNNQTVIGGVDQETIAEIKRNAPLSFQSGQRLVTKNDYYINLISYSYISKAIVWGVYEINTDQGLDPWAWVPSEENFVYISALDNTYEQLDNATKLSLLEDINDSKSPTDLVKFVDSFISYVYFDINAKVNDKTLLTQNVKSNIISAIQSQYNIENQEYFTPIRFSDYIRYIDEVEGVSYHYSQIKFYNKEALSVTGACSFTLGVPTIEAGSVEIIAIDDGGNEFLIGTDNGVGQLVPEAGYTFGTTNLLSYQSGVGNFTVLTGLSDPFEDYIIKIHYLCADRDSVPIFRYQIFALDIDECTINVDYS